MGVLKVSVKPEHYKLSAANRKPVMHYAIGEALGQRYPHKTEVFDCRAKISVDRGTHTVQYIKDFPQVVPDKVQAECYFDFDWDLAAECMPVEPPALSPLASDLERFHRDGTIWYVRSNADDDVPQSGFLNEDDARAIVADLNGEHLEAVAQDAGRRRYRHADEAPDWHHTRYEASLEHVDNVPVEAVTQALQGSPLAAFITEQEADYARLHEVKTRLERELAELRAAMAARGGEEPAWYEGILPALTTGERLENLRTKLAGQMNGNGQPACGCDECETQEHQGECQAALEREANSVPAVAAYGIGRFSRNGGL